MAIMHPSMGPREFDPRSKEGTVYYKLKDRLSEEFTVVHSVALYTTMNGRTRESELDFLIFHKDLGILCLEVKATLPEYRDGKWYYLSGEKMKKDSPYRQVRDAQGHLLEYFGYRNDISHLKNRCVVQNAVWFFTADKSSIKGINDLPEADAERTMFESDLDDPESAIRRVMGLQVGNKTTSLNDAEARLIIEKLLCASCQLVLCRRSRLNEIERTFLRLLEEQKAVLKFLEYQRIAAISGPAGSGKTRIAIQRAEDLSTRGDSVLFLCYNAMLKDELKRECGEISDLIHVDTIKGFAGLGQNGEADYSSLALRLMEYEERECFPYKHVIIDEGQDFGSVELESEEILKQLIKLTRQNKGSFYIFYDKNQSVQSRKLPTVIQDADCKCTLYANCRNTKFIAESSMSGLKECKEGEVVKLARQGTKPQLFFSTITDEQAAFVNREIKRLQEEAVEEIVILTCKALEDDRVRVSSLKEYFDFKKGKYVWRGTKIPVYTCRTFKGLEAEAIILIDVTSHIWPFEVNRNQHDPEDGLLFYTGASRAKYNLSIVCDMDDEDCNNVLEVLGEQSRRNPFRTLSNRLKAKPIDIRDISS